MVLEKVIEIIAQHIDLDPSEVTAHTKFDDLGIDSLEVIELLMTMEEEFGTEIELEGTKLTIVKDLADIIAAKV